jgi:hypothetical protein
MRRWPNPHRERSDALSGYGILLGLLLYAYAAGIVAVAVVIAMHS